MIVRGKDSFFFYSCSLALTGNWAAIDRWQLGIFDTDCAKLWKRFGFMISHGLGCFTPFNVI